MDDSYDGGTSGETTDASVESGTETGGTEVNDAGSLTAAETASAFDEDEPEIQDPNEEPAAETDNPPATETTTDVDTPAPDKSEEALAFEEDVPGKTTETPSNDAKPESTSLQAEAKVSAEKTANPDAIHVSCTREDLAGKAHPETGVPYGTRVVDVNGKQLEVTVPDFDSKYDTKLDNDLLQDSRYKHGEFCNSKLKEECEKNPEWAKENFDPKQLDAIMHGKRPPGHTWHHDGAEVGHMQLVDSKVHNVTRHTGGVAIWGSKSKYN